MQTKQFQDCYWKFEKKQLVVGNAKIERMWDLSLGFPEPRSVYNKDQEDEWLEEANSYLMKNQTLFAHTNHPRIQVHGFMDDDHGIAEQTLKITVTISDKSMDSKFVLRIYPDKPFIRNEYWFKRNEEGTELEAANPSSVASPSLQLDQNSTTNVSSLGDCMESLPLKEIHTRWKSVAFRDVTDTNNNLVDEVNGLLYKNEHRLIRGNILFLEKSLKDSSLIVIKEGPTPLAHLHDQVGDFQFVGKNLFVVGSGIHERDLERSGYIRAYGSTIAVYQGGEQAGVEVIDQYHQAVRNYKAERDFFIMSNTWGDRSKDGKINESFIMSELPVAADIGVTHYQIDDGWQQGVTVNSIKEDGKWSGYHEEPGFWEVNKQRFPHGLEPIVRAAKQNNICIGLWFSPDSSNDFQNWQKDADTIIHLYRKHDIRYFKLDGINIIAKKGEMNLLQMMKEVVKETAGKVYFNLDTTDQSRLGYFDQTQYGSIFLENRYTDFGNYFPHYTLRNLWQLSRYIPAQKLQMEFLNTARNKELYGDDPLSPAQCGIAYAFATTMFSNPLVWMEVSGLSQDDQETLKVVMQSYKKLQHEILTGHILPVGEEPSGTGWTGFQSIKNDKEGYLLLLKEYNFEQEGHITLWKDNNQHVRLTPLITKIGTKSLETNGNNEMIEEVRRNNDGTFTFSLSEPYSFQLFKYSFV